MIYHNGNELAWVPDYEEKDGPTYRRIADCIEEDIQSGKLGHGTKLPPQRVIADYLKVNHGTVTRAYKLCEEKGLVKGIIGNGTFVSGSAGIPIELMTDHDESSIISLGMTLPLYEMNDHIRQYLKDMTLVMDYNIALKYCPPEGHIKHRYIASNWLKKKGVMAEPDNMIITSGTQNALAVILTTIFEKGDRIIVDEFTYTGLKSLAQYLGIILVPVGGHDCIMDPYRLSVACRRENVKGIYIMPDCHNPSASVMPQETREAIAEIIRKEKLLCIEDATYSFTLAEKMKSVSAYVPEQSFYIHGTSKAICPTFRISYLMAPKMYMKKLKEGINNLTWMASPYNAEVMSLLQSTGQYDDLVTFKLEELKERNRLFDEVFEGYDHIASETAMYRCIQLPEHYSEDRIEQEALRKGVQVFGISRFKSGIDTKLKGIRVAISSPKNHKELMDGMTIVRDILEGYDEAYVPVI